MELFLMKKKFHTKDIINLPSYLFLSHPFFSMGDFLYLVRSNFITISLKLYHLNLKYTGLKNKILDTFFSF